MEATSLLLELSLPNQNGSQDRKMRGRCGAWGAAVSPHANMAGFGRAQALLTQAPYQVRGTHNQQSPRETPKTVLSRIGVQGERCSEQPHLLPLQRTPGRRDSPSPFQPTIEPRGLPASNHVKENQRVHAK